MRKNTPLSLVSSNEFVSTRDSISRQEKYDTLASHKKGLIRVTFFVAACLVVNSILVIYGQHALGIIPTLLIPYATIRWALACQPKNNRVKLTFRRLFKTLLNYKYFIRLCEINNLHASRVADKETRQRKALEVQRKSQIFVIK